MGYYLSLVAAVLDREDDHFVQRNQFLVFGDEVFVAWCRSVPERMPAGWTLLADGTLRARYRPEGVARSDESTTSPVDSLDEPGTFRYAELWDMGRLEDVSALFHLALPPGHLPRLGTVEPFPMYARLEGERFVMGWIWEPDVWIRFTFEEVPPDVFSDDAVRLERLVKEGQEAARAAASDYISLQTQLRTWRSNLNYLEEQAALYGARVPVDIHNQVEHARAQIADVEQRIAELSRW